MRTGIVFMKLKRLVIAKYWS